MRVVVIIVLVLLVALGIYFIYSKINNKVEEVKNIEPKKVEITKVLIKDEFVYIQGKVTLNAAIPTGGAIDSVIQTKVLLANKVSMPVRIQLKETAGEVSFSTRLKVDEILKAIRPLQTLDSLTLATSTVIKLDIPGLEQKELVIKYTDKVDNMKLPEFKPGPPKVTKFGLKNFEIILPLYLTNNDDYSLFAKMENVRLEGLEEMKVEVQPLETIKLRAFQKDTVPIRVHVKMHKGLRVLRDIIKKKARYASHLKGTIQVTIHTKKGDMNIPITLNSVQPLNISPSTKN
jgi:hypothetical protein